jgi:hypothetical protein
MTKKDFALNQIAPYYKDPMTCGYNGLEDSCKYITETGTMCVAGKNMLPEIVEKYKDMSTNISVIIETEGGQGKVFKPEAVGILDNSEWRRLQIIHDTIAKKDSDYLPISIIFLDLFTLEELKAHAEKL